MLARDLPIKKKTDSHIKKPGCKFHTDEPQKLGANIQNLSPDLCKLNRNNILDRSLGVPRGWSCQIFLAIGTGKMKGLPTGRIYMPPPDDIPGPHFCYRLSGTKAIVRPEGLSQWKTIQMTPSGIEHANFRLVAQCFNQPYGRYSDSLRA